MALFQAPTPSALAIYSYLAYVSAAPDSFFWFFYLFHVFILSTFGTASQNLVALAAAPAAVALALACAGRWAGALVSLVVGSFGVSLYLVLARTFDNSAAARRREAELKLRLAEFRVTQERSRIARDLHDSVGAQLAALLWRVRTLASSTGQGVQQSELKRVESRVVDSLAQLRNVVVSLRDQPKSWDDVVSLLRERCRELCGSTEFVFDAKRVSTAVTTEDVLGGVHPAVLELVRNASCHSGADRIEVRLTLDSAELRVVVLDDGHGFDPTTLAPSAGGLRNVHQRVEELGGRLELASERGAGVRAEIVLPSGHGARSAGPPERRPADDTAASRRTG
jgi:signal transduction histidine kinase